MQLLSDCASVKISWHDDVIFFCCDTTRKSFQALTHEDDGKVTAEYVMENGLKVVENYIEKRERS